MAPLALGLGTCKAYIESNLTSNIHSLQDFFQDVANKGVLNLPIAGKDEEPTDQQLQGLNDSTLGIISSKKNNNSHLMRRYSSSWLLVSKHFYSHYVSYI